LNEGIPVEQARDRTGCVYDTAALKDFRGQKIGQQHFPARLQHRLFQNALQFANVSRPRVRREGSHRFVGHDEHEPVELDREASNVMLDEPGQVAASRRKRG